MAHENLQPPFPMVSTEQSNNTGYNNTMSYSKQSFYVMETDNNKCIATHLEDIWKTLLRSNGQQ